ncbi:hypothetical protein [Arthrobacter sp. RCC_34]|uniref:hypothetical protein n=1 Tax=Arthrobacter sp. RCC_34 TaxID=3239230 RepID=UPI0035234103
MESHSTLPETVLQLLRDASAGEEGWAERYGGPEGVERLAVELSEQLSDVAAELAQLRAAAIAVQLRSKSVVQVAQSVGISRQAVYKASRVDGHNPFSRLATSERNW